MITLRETTCNADGWEF